MALPHRAAVGLQYVTDVFPDQTHALLGVGCLLMPYGHLLGKG